MARGHDLGRRIGADAGRRAERIADARLRVVDDEEWLRPMLHHAVRHRSMDCNPFPRGEPHDPLLVLDREHESPLPAGRIPRYQRYAIDERGVDVFVGLQVLAEDHPGSDAFGIGNDEDEMGLRNARHHGEQHHRGHRTRQPASTVRGNLSNPTVHGKVLRGGSPTRRRLVTPQPAAPIARQNPRRTGWNRRPS